MNMYDYFIHSLKQHLKFLKLVQVMEMNGNIFYFKCEHQIDVYVGTSKKDYHDKMPTFTCNGAS